MSCRGELKSWVFFSQLNLFWTRGPFVREKPAFGPERLQHSHMEILTSFSAHPTWAPGFYSTVCCFVPWTREIRCLPWSVRDGGLSQLEYWGSFIVSLIFIPGKIKRWSDLSESRQGALNSQTLSFHSLDPTTAPGYDTCPNLFVVQHKSRSFPRKPNPNQSKLSFSRGSKWPLFWIHLPRNTLLHAFPWRCCCWPFCSGKGESLGST